MLAKSRAVLMFAASLLVLPACEDYDRGMPDDYAPPKVYFTVTPEFGDINTWFVFSTTGSRDGDNLQGTLFFRYDYNADGFWDTPYVKSTDWVHVFPESGVYLVRVQAKDRYGQTSVDSVQLETYGAIPDTAHIRDPRDGQVYKTVRIAGLTWMAENLNYGRMIPVTDAVSDNDLVEKYCLYDDSAMRAPAGGHYTYYDWMEMMNHDTTGIQGICMPGWELPTKEDWRRIVEHPKRDLRYFTQGGMSNLNLTLSGFPVRLKDWSDLGDIRLTDSWVYFTRDFYRGYLYGPDKAIPFIVSSDNHRNHGHIYSLNYSNDSIRKHYGIAPVRCVKRD